MNAKMDAAAMIKNGDNMFQKTPKCSAEFLAITYGVFVMKLLKEANDNDPSEVNA